MLAYFRNSEWKTQLNECSCWCCHCIRRTHYKTQFIYSYWVRKVWLILVYAPLSSFSISGSIGQKKNIIIKLTHHMYMKKLRTWIKKKNSWSIPTFLQPSWHLCYDSEALTEEKGVGSKDITQWYDHLPWPPPTNVPLWVRPPCSHMTMMIITSVQKKLQVLHALQMMGFHSLSKPTIASVMKLTQYKRIGHTPLIITTCI